MDKEQIKEYKRKWYLKNKERLKESKKEYMRHYNLKIKETRKEYDRQYYLENKEKISQSNKAYDQTDNGKKRITIKNWKSRGVVDEDNDNYEKMYKIYLSVKYCERCNCQLNQENYNSKKCLDHDHNTGYFRNVVCNYCNLRCIN
tara:strand:+ start:185 stop:619 length:435 start_codon:yes stop_codon:yes gene_type:complete